MSAADETRPWIASGVLVWSAVVNATIAQTMPTPAMKNPASTTGSELTTRSRSPRPKSPSPMPTQRTSPIRRMRKAAVKPPAIEPKPCSAANTPKNEGLLPRWEMTEKISVSANPMTRRAIVAPVTIWRSGKVRQTCSIPAVSSRRKWCSGGSGVCSGTRIRDISIADPANVAASRTATVPPPKAA